MIRSNSSFSLRSRLALPLALCTLGLAAGAPSAGAAGCVITGDVVGKDSCSYRSDNRFDLVRWSVADTRSSASWIVEVDGRRIACEYCADRRVTGFRYIGPGFHTVRLYLSYGSSAWFGDLMPVVGEVQDF